MSMYEQLYIRLSANLVALALTVPEICVFILTELVKFACNINYALHKVKLPFQPMCRGYKNKAQVKFVVLLCLIHRYTHIPLHMGKYVFASFICQHVHFLHFVF